MDVTFLEYLDDLYAEVCKINNIQKDNEEFRIYENLIPLDFTTKNAFLCLKAQKTKILFCQSNVKVYLSDNDIISSIVNLDGNTVNFLMNEFVELFKKPKNIFKFQINDQVFYGKGINYVDSDTNFLLHTDNVININEFIFILNMIFEKDRLFSEVAKKDLLKFTLCKYISLIGYYKLKQNKYSDFLHKIKYPIEKEVNEVFNSPRNIEKYNKLFERIQLFEKEIIA